MSFNREEFWSKTSDEVLNDLNCSLNGLTSEEAIHRSELFEGSQLTEKEGNKTLQLLISQFKSPIIIILIVTAILAAFLGDKRNFKWFTWILARTQCFFSYIKTLISSDYYIKNN